MAQFRIFQMPEDVSNWASIHFSASQMSDFDVKKHIDSGLADYKGGYYKIINLYLRAGSEKCNGYDVEGLQNQLLKCKLPDNITAYRYVCIREWISIRCKTLWNKTYIYPTFLSTTLLPKYYGMPEIKWGRVKLKILLPRGTRGMYIPEVNPNMPEFEVLLPHHTHIKSRGFCSYIVD